MSYTELGLKQFLEQHRCRPLMELRALIKDYWKKNHLPRPRGAWLTAEIPEWAWKRPSSKPTKVVGAFAPQSKLDEPQTLPEIPDYLQVAYPVVQATQTMTFHIQKNASELDRKNSLGISEASKPGPEVKPDWIFVPALLADNSGHRIGRGGGFYDRYLSSHPEATTVGVLHSDYLMPGGLPVEWLKPNDCRLDAILTDKDFFWCKEKDL